VFLSPVGERSGEGYLVDTLIRFFKAMFLRPSLASAPPLPVPIQLFYFIMPVPSRHYRFIVDRDGEGNDIFDEGDTFIILLFHT